MHGRILNHGIVSHGVLGDASEKPKTFIATLITSNGRSSPHGTVNTKIINDTFATVSLYVANGVDLTSGYINSGKQTPLYAYISHCTLLHLSFGALYGVLIFQSWPEYARNIVFRFISDY